MLGGKVALVTGASGGIGRAIAEKMGALGVQVVVHYNGSEERALATCRAIEEQGGKAEIFRCDIADFQAVSDMIKDIKERLGSVDIVVNNAGITRDGLVLKMTEEDFDAVIATNLKGCFNTLRAASPIMLKQRGGRIINISSVSGIAGNPGQVNYSASKAGIIGMTKSAAKELGSRGITVNAIAPGFIDTDMAGKLPEQVISAAVERIPMKRMGKPGEVAALAAFLASDEASYITGAVINVDGGLS